jgi:hypothetical protein
MRNISDKRFRENKNTQITFNKFVKKSCLLRNNVEKYGRARKATNENIIMAHIPCMLDNKCYRSTLTLCNTHCF